MVNQSHPTVEFRISYDGPLLQEHSIDVKEFAPALMALGQLFEEVNRILNENRASVNLHIKANEGGSFESLLELIQHPSTQKFIEFFSGSEITAANNLLAIIFGGGSIVGVGKGLFWLIKKLKGGKVDKIEDLGNGIVSLEFQNEKIEISTSLLRLYQDVGVRQAAQDVVKPLAREGIDVFAIKHKKEIIETVTKEEVAYYQLPVIEDELVTETEHNAAYSIISLAFKEDNKWRLYDGNSTIHTLVKDEDFLRRVENNLISFSKGDILICAVKTIQYRNISGLRTEYEVLKVLEHRPAARQLLLTLNGK